VRGCTGREPILVGKPAPLLVDYLVDKYRCERSRILMVGDRLDTDVLFGADHGLQTLLVLSGVTTEAALLDESNDIRPDAYADSIADLC
jgi:ribonucleotide monophosphatase NagD (HAD superfamily)